ncbi:uncharacterized protein METZ01_LOCUS243092, partial [marine metagenome]
MAITGYATGLLDNKSQRIASDGHQRVM